MTTTQPTPFSALERQEYRRVAWDSVRLHPENTRRGDVEFIVESIRLNGWFGSCGVQRSTQFLIWGNHRFQAGCEARARIARARAGGWDATSEEEAELIDSWRSWPERYGELDELPVEDLDVDDEEALRILLMDNRASDVAEWEKPGLASVLQGIEERRGTLDGTGFSRPDLEALVRDARALDSGFARPETVKLSDRFLVPPFTVLDARQGYWQTRKREWLSLGIRSELGRARNLLKSGETSVFLNPDKYGDRDPSRPAPNRSTPASDSGNDPQFYFKKQQAEARIGRELTTAEFLAEHYEGPDAYWEGTSLFDPVLCELAYRWFSPLEGRVLDPFAGGSVRGIVASRLGREYHGIDLRPEQCAANEEQRAAICRPADPAPTWHVGDARDAAALVDGEFDLLFSCPPYFNLEQYGDDPGDLSNASDWATFTESFGECIRAGAAMLRPGRFAVFVVGNLRENERLLDLQGATIEACRAAELDYYNDAVLVTALGSVPLRAARNFARRKLGRTHQAVLVFVKGSLEEALSACGPIDVADVDAAVAAVPVVT